MKFRGRNSRLTRCQCGWSQGCRALGPLSFIVFILRIRGAFLSFSIPLCRRGEHRLQNPFCPCAVSPGTCRREEPETFLEAGLERCRPEGLPKHRSAPTPSNQPPKLTSSSSGKGGLKNNNSQLIVYLS